MAPTASSPAGALPSRVPWARRALALRARTASLLALLGGLAALKAASAFPPVGHHALDASNFYQIARHVAAGDGLLTDVSLYHQGLRELPHASLAYPLWPLLLGVAGAAIGLERAARVLPPLLFLASLVALDALVRPIAAAFGDRGGVPGTRGALDVGHVAVALFGLNPIYFRHTSLAYAEGLAFSLAFLAVVAVDRADGPRGSRWAGLAGALAGAAFLARSQMAGVALALPLAIASAGRSRRALGRATVAALAALAVASPWLLFLSKQPGAILPRAFFDFTAFRETPELSAFALSVPAPGPLAYALDRLDGLRAAFTPGGAFSYFRSFGAAVALLPLGALAWVERRWSRRPAPGTAAGGRTLPRLPRRSIAARAAMLSAALCLAPVHLHHATYLWPWWFHWRHGLPLVFAIAPALAALAACRSRALRLGAAAVVALALVGSSLSVAELRAEFRARPAGPHPDERALLAWVAAQPRGVVFVATHPQVLAAYGRAGGYRWLRCGDRPSVVEAMRDALGIDGVVVYPGEERCPFARGLEAAFPLRRRFGSIALWLRGRPGPARGPARAPGGRRAPGSS